MWIRCTCAVAILAACRHDHKRVTAPADDMVVIPARTFVGTALECAPGTTARRTPSATSNAQLEAPAFQIDRRLVTCEQFERCVSAGVCKHDDLMCVDGLISVRRKTATAYCQWRNAKLPSWNEWQLAIRGPEGWQYPTADKRPEYDFEEVGGTHVASTFGVEYRFNAKAPLNAELTRDDDCFGVPDTPDAPVMIGPVSGQTAIQLGETVRGEEMERGSFRCVRD
jgi:hypothetical protein